MKKTLYFLLALALILLDQMTKYHILNFFTGRSPLEITSFFNLGLWFNKGAAFSFLGEASGWQRWFFIGLAGLASVYLTRALYRLPKEDKISAYAFTCVISGALGNAIDRVRLGHVVDFLDFHVGAWHWPAFNVADITICIGVFLLIITLFRPEIPLASK